MTEQPETTGRLTVRSAAFPTGRAHDATTVAPSRLSVAVPPYRAGPASGVRSRRSSRGSGSPAAGATSSPVTGAVNRWGVDGPRSWSQYRIG